MLTLPKASLSNQEWFPAPRTNDPALLALGEHLLDADDGIAGHPHHVRKLTPASRRARSAPPTPSIEETILPRHLRIPCRQDRDARMGSDQPAVSTTPTPRSRCGRPSVANRISIVLTSRSAAARP